MISKIISTIKNVHLIPSTPNHISLLHLIHYYPPLGVLMPNSRILMLNSRIPMLRRSILWLCVLALIIVLTYYCDKSLFTDGWDAIATSSAKRELLIYCVKTDKPQVTISFDAAWGNAQVRVMLTCADLCIVSFI